jgi:hypothetical protein
MNAAAVVIAAEQEADAALEAEIETHLRPRLREAAMSDALRRPLVLASPALSDALSRSDRQPSTPGPTKCERSLVAYLARAAAKTSPFSAFMHCALMELDEGDGPSTVRLPDAARRTRAYVNRGSTGPSMRCCPPRRTRRRSTCR